MNFRQKKLTGLTIVALFLIFVSAEHRDAFAQKDILKGTLISDKKLPAGWKCTKVYRVSDEQNLSKFSRRLRGKIARTISFSPRVASSAMVT